MSGLGGAKVLAGAALLVGFGVALAGGDPRALFDPAVKSVTAFTGSLSDSAPEIVDDAQVTAGAFGSALRNGMNSLATEGPLAPAQQAPVTTLPTPVE